MNLLKEKIQRNLLFILILILSCLSIITITGILPQLENYGTVNNSIVFILKQIVGIVVGIVLIFLIKKITINNIEEIITKINFVLITMLIILALNPPVIGDLFVKTINGASGWFNIPILNISIQPIEFFKITMLLQLSFVTYHANNNKLSVKEIIKKFIIFGFLPIFCILLQPDLGGTLLLILPCFVLLILSLKNNAKFMRFLKYFLVLTIFGFILLIIPQTQELITKYTPIQAYQLARINSWLEPFNYDGGYQLQQALILMGSSGPFGYGFGNINILLPEPHTDVIFAEFCGMFGYVGGIFLILIYMYLLYVIFQTILICDEEFDFYLLIAIFMLFFIQIIENIGMMLGVLPITGIVLPFMSYGVSALITYFILIGLVNNIRNKYIAKLL